MRPPADGLAGREWPAPVHRRVVRQVSVTVSDKAASPSSTELRGPQTPYNGGPWEVDSPVLDNIVEGTPSVARRNDPGVRACETDCQLAEWIPSRRKGVTWQTRRSIPSQTSPWTARLWEHVAAQEVVLRAIAVSRRQYASYLRRVYDWGNGTEDPQLVGAIAGILPRHLWLVEISIPDLFAANHRKIGEIVLDSDVPADPPDGSHHLVLLRLPCVLLLPGPGFPAKR